MRYVANTDKLIEWAARATLSESTWFRPRKELWDQLKELIQVDPTKGDYDPTKTAITPALFNSIKSALHARSEKLTDQQLLAFETACQEIITLAAERREQLEWANAILSGKHKATDQKSGVPSGKQET
jgi:hypothetical protein